MKSLNLFSIKSVLFLLIPLSCFLFSCSAESQTIKAKSCLEVRELKGKVKSIRETVYYAEVVDGEIKKTEIEDISVTSFNKAYTAVELIQYYPDGSGRQANRQITNYDSNNNLVEWIQYPTIDSKPNAMKISSKYDEKGNMIETLGYGTDGKLYNKGTYKYDEKSRMIESISSYLTDSAEQPWRTDTAKYILDAEGRTIEEIISISDIIIRNTYKYSNFDNEGNWLVQTTGDPPESITERVIEYY